MVRLVSPVENIANKWKLLSEKELDDYVEWLKTGLLEKSKIKFL